MHNAPDSTSHIAPPVSPLRVGSKPPEKRRRREKAPKQKPQKKEKTGDQRPGIVLHTLLHLRFFQQKGISVPHCGV